MTLQVYIDIISQTLQNVFAKTAYILPNLVGAIIIFLIGLAIASLLQRLWLNLAKYLNLEKSFTNLDLYNNFVKVNKNSTLTDLLAGTIFLITVAIFGLGAIKALGLKEADQIINLFQNFLPTFTLGIFILLTGSIVAQVSYTILLIIGGLVRINNINLIASLSSILVILFTIYSSLKTFGIDDQFIRFFAIALLATTSLSFGLAGKDLVSDFFKKYRNSFK